MQPKQISPFTFSNVKRFIAFRAFFNCRFYYPVFTILFLDYGLTIEQFALLNSVWAFTIVLAEVPSGALADLIGRRRLLVATAWLMILEMALLSFVPLGNSKLIFTAFLVNRILSGLAEALASGADEAMAYDTLLAHGQDEEWPRVLDIQMRVRNFFYIITMTVGALVYDPGAVNSFLHFCGLQETLSQQTTMRFPIYLSLCLGILSLFTTLGMRDPATSHESPSNISAWQRIRNISRLTFEAGKWIINTPTALIVILFAMTFDHVLRMLVTLNSQYYRTIDLPEASFGLIGSSVACIGLVVPRLARAMVERLQPVTNLLIVFNLAMISLWGLTLFVPWYGVLPMILVFITMMLTSFFTSAYLNKIAESKQRATILSYKGLAFNATYGLIGIFYALLINNLRNKGANADSSFQESITWFPYYLLITLVLVTVISLYQFRWNNNK